MIVQHPEKSYRLNAIVTTNMTQKQLEKLLEAIGVHSYALQPESISPRENSLNSCVICGLFNMYCKCGENVSGKKFVPCHLAGCQCEECKKVYK